MTATSHTAIGELHFEDWKPGTPRRALHHFDVELWERGFLGHARRLAAGTSGLDGSFALPFSPEDAGHRGLELRLYEVRRHGEDEVRHLVHLVDRGPAPLEGAVDFGEVAVPYWPYAYAGPLPRVLIPPGAAPPQDYAPGRKTALLKELAALGLVRAKHLLENRLDPLLPAIATIQADYPANATLRLEQATPGASRGDAYFAERTFNGFHPARVRADGALWRVAYRWDDCEMDGTHVLPNADAWFALGADGPLPVRIALQRRLPAALAAGSACEPWATYTPADGDAWRRAQRLFRVAWSLHGQIEDHLTRAHLNMEQYAVAAWRNFRRSPLRELLFPHLKDVVVINHGGTDLIFGERGFVTTASALTARAIDARFVAGLGRCDWAGFRPRAPLWPGHTFARAAGLFWDVVGAHVDEFLAAHAEAIAADWDEVVRFSDDLVHHAVPWMAPGALAPEDSEAGDENAPRSKAVSPIRDLADLAQVARYVIYHATFFHAWANDRQHDDGGELRYNAIGLRGDGWGPEHDDAIAPAPAQATDQVFLALFLQNTRYGYLLKNEDGDVPRRFVELLDAQAGAFRALGVDPAMIRSCINI